MSDLPPELRAALDRALATVPRPRLQAATARLVDAYRAPGPPPVLATADDAAAYAAYRMPATYAAVRAALRSAALRTAAPVTAAPVTAAPVTAAPDTAAPVTAAPDTAARHRARALAPGSRLDLGGGTGAAGWAAAETFPTISTVTVLDRSAAALALGRRLAAAGRPAVRGAAWRRWRLRPGTALPAADLVTACCLLGELSPAERPGLVGAMAAAGSAVLLVEPGTPDGYRRVLAARTQLLQAGWIVQAPCPHHTRRPAGIRHRRACTRRPAGIRRRRACTRRRATSGGVRPDRAPPPAAARAGHPRGVHRRGRDPAHHRRQEPGRGVPRRPQGRLG